MLPPILFGLMNIRALDALAFASCSWFLYYIIKAVRARACARTTKLHGPRANSWLFGVSRDVLEGDSGALFENWAKTYGPVFQVPGPMGDRRTVLMDPKALAYYFSKTNTYVRHSFARKFVESMIGRGVVWAEGTDHKRQRRILNPAFNNSSIRELVSVFYDSAYKVKTAWDSTLSDSTSGEAIIDVQKWMNRTSLDAIGIAAFDHDFGALDGKRGAVEEGFDTLNTAPLRGLSGALYALGSLFPILLKVPTERHVRIKGLHRAMQEVAEGLLQKTKKDSQAGTFSASSRSIMGTLLRAENSNEKSNLTEEEVFSQMKTFMLAGLDTTSVSLTWAFIELARHMTKQDLLRKELLAFANGEDTTYDQLMNELPYLDAVLREILRLHPAVVTNNRLTACEDVIQLQGPVSTTSGEVINQITIGTGSTIIVPIQAINRSDAIWGPDAKEFKPERWLEDEIGLTPKSKEMPGYHHLLTFIDGPRTCLGKQFAVAEFKAVLSVLIRNFVFELRDGPETKIELLTTLLPHPKIVGEDGVTTPMRVRQVQLE